MPLRLNVGVSRKIGLPDYSSIGASCNLELELESGLLQNDLDGLHAQIRGAYVAANQAVNDELDRFQALPVRPCVAPEVSAGGDGRHDRAAVPANGPLNRPTEKRATHARGPKPATAGQVKAIYAIARAQRADLEGLLRDEYGVARPEELSLADASQFIDQLKAVGGI